MFGASHSQAARSIPVLIAIYLLALPAHAKYSGGSGTEKDPYQIATAADLMLLGETPGDYDKHFILTADIDLDPKLPGRRIFDKAVIARHTGSGKDSYQGAVFAGVFDGNGHTISHLTIQGGSWLGLFGILSGADVKDLGVVDVNVTGSGWNVGALVGSMGGGTVTHCHSTGTVSGNSSVGGLVGATEGGIVTQCYTAGAVSGTEHVGGLVGDNWLWGIVTLCYSACTVGGDDSVGGLVGYGEMSTVTQCYSTGAVSGKNGVGGLVGSIFGTVRQCYSTGRVGGDAGVGGLAGSICTGCDVTGCFWDRQTSGQTRSAGGTGKTTAEMQEIQTYRDAGWDLWSTIEDGASEIWQMPEGGGYPFLAIFNRYRPPQLRGTGTPQDPYVIADSLELGALIYYSPCAHYRLANSIDLSGIRWGTAVVPWFAGVFDGNGHTISHLTIQGRASLGLFGQLLPGAEVKNLGVPDVNIIGTGYAVGGLAGANGEFDAWNPPPAGGSVTGCYSTGRISGAGGVGGLVGANHGTVTWCYSTCTVSGDDSVGGLAGHNDSSLAECYSAGAVSGKSYVGGLVGRPGVEDRDSGTYIGRATACFWDIQTSGQTTSGGGIGRTTGEMQTAKTFLDAGWDFVGETKNGTDDVWWILEGKDYPRLWWETAKK